MSSRLREGERVLDDRVARLGRADDLDQHHLGDRVEEVQADQASGIGEAARELLEDDARGVGRENGVRLHARLELRVELALGVGVLEDRLDDDVGARDAGGLDVRGQARRHLGGLGRVAGALGEELARAGERGLDVLQLAVLQRDREAARRAPGGDVAAHDARADDVDVGDLARRLAAQRLHAVLQEEDAHEVARLVGEEQARDRARLGLVGLAAARRRGARTGR